MHLLFVDESGTPPAPGGVKRLPVFVLGGLIVPEEVWAKLKNDLELTKRKFGVDGEIKWRYFAAMRGKPHPLSHLNRDKRDRLREELLDAIARYKSIRIVAVIVDTRAAYATGACSSADEMYHDAFKRLGERFQYFLQDLERQSGISMRGIIVCDNRNNDQDDRLKEFHQRLLAGGRHTSRYENLVEGLFIAASHHSPGTQFADLVAGAVYRREVASDSRHFDRIAERVRRGPEGQMSGYGLVHVPK